MGTYENTFEVGCRSIVGRRINVGLRAMKTATRRGGTNVVPKTYVVPVNDREGAKAFSNVVLQFSSGELAQASKRTKEAAKGWKDARSMPSVLSILNMSQDIPAVRNWMLGMMGITDPRDAVPQDAANALLGGLQFVAQIPGPDGAKARALLAKMGRDQ